MYDFAGKTALITGGSMGIGAAFAHTLAARGAGLVLVARGHEALAAVAETIRRDHDVPVEILAADLSTPSAAERIYETLRARGLTVDVLVNNAGFAAYGPFTEVAVETQRGQIDVNVGALIELTHRFLPDIEARRGGVIHVASTAAFQPVPYMAVYGATKAFVLSFSEALWAEYRPRGVRVLALCPGATDTPFFARAGEEAAFGAKATPEDVVRVGVAAFDANRPYVIYGAVNYVTAHSGRFFPRRVVAWLSGRLMRPRPDRALPAGQARP